LDEQVVQLLEAFDDVEDRLEDVDAYEAFLSRWLLPNPFIASVSSGFTLRELKTPPPCPSDTKERSLLTF
jgi:hypothetical protein